MINILRTNADHPDFVSLVQLLDAELAERDGEDHAFYAQFNKIDQLEYVLIAYNEEKAMGCGAIKKFNDNSMEIKRMYVLVESRAKGIGTLILNELEKWIKELDYRKCILETGKRQPEAIQLYKKNGYQIIPNFGQYAGDANSVCFEKRLY